MCKITDNNIMKIEKPDRLVSKVPWRMAMTARLNKNQKMEYDYRTLINGEKGWEIRCWNLGSLF